MKYQNWLIASTLIAFSLPVNANYTITPVAPIGAPSYYFDSGAYGGTRSASLNDSGQIAGSYRNSLDQRYIYLWDKTSGLSDLWQQPGRQDITTHVIIGNNGLVGQGDRLGDQSGYQQLTFPSLTIPSLRYIGDDGTLGVSTDLIDVSSVIRNPDDSQQIINELRLITMNNNNDFIGIIPDTASTAPCFPAGDGLGEDCLNTAVVSINNQIHTIAEFSQGYLMDMNDNGQVLWWEEGGFNYGRIFEDGVSTILAGEGSTPWALNNDGTIVGRTCEINIFCLGNYQATIWTDVGHSSLIDLIVNDTSGIELFQAVDINENGEILAEGLLNGVQYSFYLAPVPLPAAIWLFGSGLIGLIGIARRKTRA